MSAALDPLAPAEDFPQLSRAHEGQRIVYLDSAATSLKPQPVIDAVLSFYRDCCGNVHRGDHLLSREASARYEEARHIVARFINATAREVAFTSNTTDGLNLVAHGLGLESDCNVVVTVLEHHSNLLPWMSRCQVRFLPTSPDGVVDLERLPALLDSRTRMLAISHASNVTGALNPVADAIRIAHEHGVPVVVDAAQSVPHHAVDVLALDCDALAFSAHKMLGPSGVGVLYIKEELAARLRPFRLGGGTPDHVRSDGFELKDAPYRFEAGTPNIEGVLGLGAAIEYLERLGMARVAEHDAALTRALHERFSDIPGLVMLGPSQPELKVSIVSLAPTSSGITVASLAHVLSDSYKVMARAGTHCAHPFFESEGIGESLRLSPYLYNGSDDLDRAARALQEIL